MIEIKDDVAYLTLNRPEKKNALNEEVISALSDALDMIDVEHARCLVLQGAGNVFCAGADLAHMKSMATKNLDENVKDAKQLANLFFQLNTLSIPTIAKVHGAAFGGALGLIACCDIAVASSETKFCFSEVKLGLAPAMISPYVIPCIGERNARRYFLTAEVFEAEEAKSIGMIQEVVEKPNLDKAVTTIANKIKQNSPNALMATKRLILEHANKSVEDTASLISNLRASEEGLEGLQAFLENRKPNWSKG